MIQNELETKMNTAYDFVPNILAKKIVPTDISVLNETILDSTHMDSGIFNFGEGGGRKTKRRGKKNKKTKKAKRKINKKGKKSKTKSKMKRGKKTKHHK